MMGADSKRGVAKELGLADQTLRNGVRALKDDKPKGAGSKAVTPEQMELPRLRAENARSKRESDITKTAAAYFAKDLYQF